MNSIKVLSVVATAASKFYNLIAVVLFHPFFIEYLGVEAFAVVSAAMIINTVLGLLDAGITPLVVRDVADAHSCKEKKNSILGSYELVYISIFCLLGVTSATFYALNTHLDFIDEGSEYFRIYYFSGIFVLDFCFQLLCRFYISALQGMERHVFANALYLGMAILRTGILVLILRYFPTVETFFVWQLLVSICCFFVFRKIIYSGVGIVFSNPFIHKGLLWSRLLSLRQLSLISIIAVCYGQADRLFFIGNAELLRLPMYTVPGSFSAIITSVALVLIPLLIPLMTNANGDFKKVRLLRLSHTACWYLSAIIAVHMLVSGPALMSVFFTEDKMIYESAQYFNFLILGNFLSSLTVALYVVNISASRFNHHLIIIGVVTFSAVPIYFLALHFFGLIGIPIGFVILQSVLVFWYVSASLRKMEAGLHSYRFILFPLIFAFVMLVADYFLMNLISKLGLFDSFHPYLVFCLSIIPLLMASILVFPFCYWLCWGRKLKSDFQSWSS